MVQIVSACGWNGTYDAMSKPRFFLTNCVSSAASIELVPHLCIDVGVRYNMHELGKLTQDILLRYNARDCGLIRL